MHPLRPLALSLLGSFACLDAFVSLPVGPVEMAIDLPVDSIPASLRQQDGTLRAVTCNSGALCPATGAEALALRCAGNVCALVFGALDVTSPGIDLSTYETWRRYADGLTRVRLLAANVQVLGGRPNHSLGPLTLYWRGANPTVERRLGTMARTALSPGRVDLPVVLDPVGADALAASILAGSVQFRVRVTGTLEVGPGPLPDPQLRIDLNLLLGLVGSV